MMPGAREDLGEGLYPLDHIGGFDVRPGFFRMNGSYQTAKGVSFTVSSHGATSCTLLLFRPMAAEPYAKIRVPDNYKIGDTYSILVFGLKIGEFEYAYQFDGPYDEARESFLTKKIFFWIHMHRLSQDRENGASVRKVEKISYIRRTW